MLAPHRSLSWQGVHAICTLVAARGHVTHQGASVNPSVSSQFHPHLNPASVVWHRLQQWNLSDPPVLASSSALLVPVGPWAHERAVIEYDASIRHAGGACAAAASHRGLPAGILQVEHINFLQVHSKTPEHSAKLCRRSAQRTRTHPTRLHRSISPPRSGVSEAVPATRDLSDLFFRLASGVWAIG